MTDTKNKKKSEDDILEELLANVPSNDEISVELPSKGKFYNLIDPAKPVTVRPMTFKDEKAMMNPHTTVDVINTLLTRCVSNLNIAELLIFDKLFLIMKIREISYGSEYSVNVNCASCKKENRVKFDLANLAVNYAHDELTDPCLVKLRILGKDAKIKFPRVRDEEYLVTSEITASNLWRFIEEIDGHTKKTIITKVAENLPIQDAHTVLDVLGGEGLGINTRVTFACNFCSNSEVIDLPITSDFFTGN